MANVVVRFTIEAVMQFSEGYDSPSHVNFVLNDGTQCADTLADHLADWVSRHDPEDEDGEPAQATLGGLPCLCSVTKAEFVRVATQADLKQLPVLDEDEDRRANELSAA